MNNPAPIYTLENCKAAYQLNWALSLFWHDSPRDCLWLADLMKSTEPDGVRIFSFGFYVGTIGEYDLGVTWL